MKNMKAYRFNCILLSVFIFASCQNSVSPKDYVNYVKDYKNGLHKFKKIGALEVDVQYRPIPYVIANEFRKNNIRQEDYIKRESELSGLQYYNVKLSVAEQGQDITKYKVVSQEDYQQRLYYLSYKMKNDIQLVEGKDTLSPILYHFERSYDISDKRTFVVAFESTQNEVKDKTLVIDAKPFGTGPIKLRMTEIDLNNLPKINLL